MTIPASPDWFIHHVLFYPRATAGPADQAHLLAGLQKLAQIPGIRLAHIGTPAGTTRAVIDRQYTYSWLCFFENAEAEQQYQHHPIHDEFREHYAAYWDRVVIYDAIGTLYGATLPQQP